MARVVFNNKFLSLYSILNKQYSVQTVEMTLTRF